MTSGLPIETLGKQIAAHVTKAQHYESKRDEHLLAAGLHLEEAFVRIRETKEMSWKRFVAVYCDLSERRARELRAIARGDTTLEATRERARESMQQTRWRRGMTEAELKEAAQRYAAPKPKYARDVRVDVGPGATPKMMAATLLTLCDRLGDDPNQSGEDWVNAYIDSGMTPEHAAEVMPNLAAIINLAQEALLHLGTYAGTRQPQDHHG